MSISAMADVDFIEELRLRRWARENYVPSNQRRHDWHPIILNEMGRKDEESFTEDPSPDYAISQA
jgi:hypothetical protein